MKSLMKHPQVLGIIGELLFLLALATGSTAYAASYTNNVHLVSHVEPPVPPVYTLKLHDAAGMAVHAENGITKPKVYTNGHSVNVTLAGKTYVVNPSDIKNYWLEVTIPREINLDLKVQNGTIQIKDIARGQMKVETENGSIIIQKSTLTGTSNISTVNGSLEFSGKIEPLSKPYFKAEQGTIQVTLPGNTQLHLKAKINGSGNLTGNFNGLPTNAPSAFDGLLNASPGQPVMTLTLSIKKYGSIALNKL